MGKIYIYRKRDKIYHQTFQRILSQNLIYYKKTISVSLLSYNQEPNSNSLKKQASTNLLALIAK